jgi:hypothetical protein
MSPILPTRTTIDVQPVTIVADDRQTKSTELLLTVDDEQQIEQVTNQCTRILDDLTDLQFDQHEQIQDEHREFQLIKQQVDQASSKLCKVHRRTLYSARRICTSA